MLKNIIIVCDWGKSIGGSIKVAIKSAIELANMNYNVVFFCGIGPVDKELLDSKVMVKCLEIQDIAYTKSKYRAVKNGVWNKKAYIEFFSLLQKYDPNETIIHYHGWNRSLSSSIFKASKKLKFNEVITLHDYFSCCPNGAFCNFKKGTICHYKPLGIKCIFSNCDKKSFFQKIFRVIRQKVQNKYVLKNKRMNYIYISKLNGNIIKKYVKSHFFYEVPNPTNAEFVSINNLDSNTYIYVGRISPEKGVDLFCEAIKQLNLEGYEIKGVVLGDGENLEGLKKLYDNICFTGWVDKNVVSDYIKKARALVLPSKWYEGFPLTIIEAMGSGLPCIVSNCTTVSYEIEDSKTGYIFQSGNVDSLKSKIIQSLNNNEYLRIQENVLKLDYSDKYSLSNHISSLINVYKSIIND